MTTKQLSNCYSIATLRLHDLTTELYEALHNKDGEPIKERNHVADLMIEFFKKAKLESSLIISSVEEFNE